MDNILITGGAGFIGSHLAERLLRQGKRLAIVDNLDDYYPADLKRQVFTTFKPDAVIHLAARPGVRMSFAQPEAYTSLNVLGTTQVLEISRQSGVRRWVFASSSSVYGHSSRAPFREDAIISHPLSIYAATKVAGEALAFTYANAYDLSVVCLRLFTVYGPRQRPDLAIRKFAGMIMEGKEVPIFGDGSLQRDYTYIEDIIDGILLALDAPGKFDVFNIGNAHPVRIDEMVDTLGHSLGQPVRKKFIPTPAGEMIVTHADLTKASQILGYSPKVSFEEGIRRFAEWLQSRK
jgi:UDP-glucuronate 4-epimerase